LKLFVIERIEILSLPKYNHLFVYLCSTLCVTLRRGTPRLYTELHTEILIFL